VIAAVPRELARWRRGSRAFRGLARAVACAVAIAVGVAVATVAMTMAATAQAARLVEVRIGRHPEFVRVVFETDAPATFSIATGGAPGETLVRLDAELAAAVAARPPPNESGAEVELESLPGGATLARIRASVPVRVESQVLDEPPRVVLDLRRAAETAELPPDAEATPGESGVPPETEPDPAPAGAEPGAAGEEIADSGRDPVATLLTELQEAPPIAEPPAPPEPDPDARAVAPASAAPEGTPESIEPPLPPVSGAPPAAIAARFDGRSLVIGAVAGLVLGVALTLGNRGASPRDGPGVATPEEPGSRPEEVVPAGSRGEASADWLASIPRETDPRAGPRAEQGPERSAAREAPSLPAPPVEGDSLAADLLQMIHRLDDRAARGDELLAGLRERVERLDRRTNAQAEELASQRLALARLQRALGQPPVRLATDGAQATPASRLGKS